MVPFTALRCGLVTYQVDLDLYTSGLTPMRCATAQVAVLIRVYTDPYVRCYDLPKVGVSP
jgi:hypothetical protein